MKKAAFLLSLGSAAMLVAAPALSAGGTRPTAVSYASGSKQSAGTLRGGARIGARTGTQSGVDDGTTLILVAAAGVAGYFLHDIIDDDDNGFTVSP